MALTLKQEDFCLKYIETGNASEAYRCSYDASRMKPESVNRKAKELIDNVKITARIAELRKPAIERHNLTVDDIINEYEEARAVAKEHGQPAAMVSATSGKARVLGLDKLIVGGDKENPLSVTLDAKTKAAKALGILAMMQAKLGDVK